jgi:hypothetical protein
VAHSSLLASGTCRWQIGTSDVEVLKTCAVRVHSSHAGISFHILFVVVDGNFYIIEYSNGTVDVVMSEHR